VAQLNGAITGPWEFVEVASGEKWKFKAVEDHYRKTPTFAELVM
jgi:ABC-type transport system substrate-binding protein